MSNTIRLNDSAPTKRWLTMSNQGTDCFFDLLIAASESFELTPAQENLVDFIRCRRDINDVAPGTAGFDIEEMPWEAASLRDDAAFLAEAAELAKDRAVWEKLDYEPNGAIVFTWLDLFASLVRETGERNGGFRDPAQPILRMPGVNSSGLTSRPTCQRYD